MRSVSAHCFAIGQGLTPRLSELAILVTAKHWNAEFEWYVHEREARAAGVADETIAAIAAGRQPALEGDAALVYAFASTFYTNQRRLRRAVRRAVERFGERTVVELTSILGYYSLLAIVLKVFRVRAP